MEVFIYIRISLLQTVWKYTLYNSDIQNEAFFCKFKLSVIRDALILYVHVLWRLVLAKSIVLYIWHCAGSDQLCTLSCYFRRNVFVFRNLNVCPCYNIDPPVSIQIFSVQKIKKYCFHLFFGRVRTISRLISMTTIGCCFLTLAQKLTYTENFDSERVIMCQFLIDNIYTAVSVRI